MKPKTKKMLAQLFLSFVLIISGIATSIILPPTAFADVASDAQTYCRKNASSNNYLACIDGYTIGATGKSAYGQAQTQGCNAYSGGVQQACQSASAAGQKAYPSPQQAAQQNATNLSQQCQNMPNQTDKNNCLVNVVCYGGTSGAASATQADQQAGCTSAAQQCLQQGGSQQQVQDCLNKAPNAQTSNTQAASSAATATSPTGNCGQAQTVLIKCDNSTTPAGVITSVLKQALTILIAGIGIVAVGGIVYGAILYASARDNSSQTQQAIGIIRNTAVGIILFVFMVAILNWLVPGGVL